MPTIFNPENLSFESNQFPVDEFSWHCSPDLSKIVKSKNLKFNVMSLDPGKFSYPYHFHRSAEELFVILSGKATLRKTGSKFEELSKNDIVFFEMGPEGAHQLYNHTDKPCIYLDLRTVNGIDICEYPDSPGKVCILPTIEIFENENKANYFKGETNFSEKWPSEIINKPRK